MPIEHDKDFRLPPLKVQRPPMVPVDALAAVDQVRMAASDIPPRILRHFYERVLGLRCIATEQDGMVFSHQRRLIRLERERQEPGQVALIIKGFDETLVRLREASVSYEVLHPDGGMTRSIILRDPAGNWVKLHETRAF
jgi:catechol-2,3-dioxygenase